MDQAPSIPGALTLKPYQQVGVDFLRSNHPALLADEPGLGKSAQALVAAVGRTLILAPAKLEDVWAYEVATWAPGLDVTFCSYSSVADRVERKAVARPRTRLRGQWDTVIYDEAHYLKNKNAMWCRAIRKLESERRYFLTGTPIPNWSHDIFNLLRLMYPRDRRFLNERYWISLWYKTWNPPWGGTEVRGLHERWTWEQFAEGNGLAGHWLSRATDDVLLSLPPLRRQLIAVDMPEAQGRAYRKLRKEAIVQIGTQEVINWWPGSESVRLLQLSTATQVLAPRGGVASSGKLDMLRLLLLERTRPTIVFTVFQESVEAASVVAIDLGRRVGRVSGRYTAAHNRVVLQAFHRGEIDVLIGTLAKLAEGLTLTEADTCIFLERSWVPSVNEQAERRIRRIGQNRPTLAITLECRGTIDEHLANTLVGKSDEQAGLINALRLLGT